jgi:hypothetical protein
MSERQFYLGQDEEAILALRSKVWGIDHLHTNMEFFRWLFHKTPYGRGSGILSLNKFGVPVSFAGISHRKAQIGHTELSIAHGLEFMVDPDVPKMASGRIGMRTLSAHRKLAKELGYDCSINFPNGNSYRMLESRQGKYSHILNTELFVYPFYGYTISARKHSNFFKRFFMSAGARSAALYSASRIHGAARDHTIRKIDEFDSSFDVFWERLQADGKLRLVRDARTLNWRYVKHPIYKYDIFLATDSQQDVIGYAVASPRNVMGTNAYLVCDVSALGNNKNVRETLIRAVIDHAKDSAVSAVVAVPSTNDTIQKELFRCGFLRIPDRVSPKQFRLLGIAFNANGNAALDKDNWLFGWGDTDVV